MQPEVRERLAHIIDAGEAILQSTTDVPFDAYAGNRILRAAVERWFGIIGEALREGARVDSSLQSITDFRRIVDFRNILVHDYATVYDEGVWRIIEHHLPRLLAEVRALLAE